MKRIQAPAIKQALLTLAIGEVRAFEALSVGEPITSEALTKRIEKLTRAQRRFTWRFVKTAKRRFVTVLVAIILLFVLSLSITAVRETVFNFVTKTFLTHTDFYISGDGEKPSLDTIAVYKVLEESDLVANDAFRLDEMGEKCVDKVKEEIETKVNKMLNQ